MSVGESSTPLGKVRGLGSAQHGGEHWLTERVTSIALLLLGTWLLASLLLLPKLDYRTLVEWLRAPSRGRGPCPAVWSSRRCSFRDSQEVEPDRCGK